MSVLHGELGADVRRLVSELQRERARQGLTVTEVADRMQVDRMLLVRTETHVVDPSLDFVQLYARALGTSIQIEVKLLPISSEKKEGA